LLALFLLVGCNAELKQITEGPDEGFVELGREYFYAMWPADIDGKLAYVASRDYKHFVILDGVQGKEYDYVPGYELIAVDGKLAYAAGNYKGDRGQFIVFDGHEEGPYETVRHLTGIDGRLAFLTYLKAELEEKDKWFVVYDGHASPKYDYIEWIKEIAGKPAYAVRNNGKSYVVFDGKELAFYYDDVYGFTDVGGKMAFIAEQDKKFFVVVDDAEGKRYDEIKSDNIYDIQGRPAYAARKENQWFVVHGAEEYGPYEEVHRIQDAGDKLAFSAVQNGESICLLDGKELRPEPQAYGEIIDVNGRLAYARYDDVGAHIIYDGRELGRQYDRIQNLRSIGDKLAYQATKNNKTFIVLEE